ncbi:MAG: ATP-binding cassette domain-containing protein [Actinobacteria bacterium]|nr:ATP-binding cassette domain-containing protein [Actinomycetota bacterium]
MFIGMVLETLGVGLVIPALALLTQKDLTTNYPALQLTLQALGNPSQQSLVIGGMLVLVGVYLIKALFLAFLAWKQTRFAFGVQAQLSQRLFTVYLHQPYTFHLQRNSAQLIRNVINEVNLLTNSGILPSMTLLTESLVLFGLCSLLLAVEPLGALIVVSVLGIAAWGFHQLTRKRIARWGKVRQHHDGSRIQHLQQGLGGAKDVKLLGREAYFLKQYHLHNVQSAQVGQLQATMQQLPRLWLELLAVSGLAILVISMLAQDRPLVAVLPTLGLFAAAAFRLMPSFNRILSSVQSLRYGLPVIDLLHTELNLVTPKLIDTRKPVTPFCSTLELRQVTYAYPGAAEPALKDISMIIQRCESVGFIGASGAGKSTLVDMLLGLLTPDTGKVLVDDKDIQINLRNWQDQIGYVPQSIFLTDDTLRRNVAFGLANEQIDDAAVQRAIQAAQLEEFVSSLPDGLETLVGERGIRLSGGQRQRIGIARALYHDPAVLVLDEATSSLDTATERGVIQAVRALHGDKTILIVAHRLSTVEHCDRLYRLEQGRLETEGNPETMLHKQLGPGKQAQT